MLYIYILKCILPCVPPNPLSTLPCPTVLEAAHYKWHQWVPLPSASCFGSAIRGHWQEWEQSEIFIPSALNMRYNEQGLSFTQVQGFYQAVLSYSCLGSFKLPPAPSLFRPHSGNGSLLLPVAPILVYVL